MDLVKVILAAPKTYIFGNFTYFSQLPLGLFCFVDGGCSAFDATTCINPVAKPLFISGAIANLGSGICMIGPFSLGFICVPAAFGVGALGTGLRRIGRYSVDSANVLEIKPTLTKMTSFGSKLADVIDNPANIIP
jgi:hypothetical protein